jgi:hypothetical protein
VTAILPLTCRVDYRILFKPLRRHGRYKRVQEAAYEVDVTRPPEPLVTNAASAVHVISGKSRSRARHMSGAGIRFVGL